MEKSSTVGARAVHISIEFGTNDLAEISVLGRYFWRNACLYVFPICVVGKGGLQLFNPLLHVGQVEYADFLHDDVAALVY